jgi:hypothetical protein
MEKEFVTYEQSLALKELGYDDTPWFGNQASLYDVDGEHTMYTNYGVMYSGINDGYIPAPLKQQVFRWLSVKLDMPNLLVPVNDSSQNTLIDKLILELKSKHLLL